MLPADWDEHRREDGEVVGWIVPEGGGYRPLDVLGRPATPGPVDRLEAEEALERRGIGFLADRHLLRTPDGAERPVRISRVGPDGVTVVTDDFGRAGAVGGGSERIELPFPAPARLRPAPG